MKKNGFADRLLGLFFPNRCVFCRRITDEAGICGECRRSLPYLKGAVRSVEFVDLYAAPLRYEGVVRASVVRYKFNGRQNYAPVYAELMRDKIMREGMEFDVITWAPVSDKRERQRGYDQSRLLAEELGRLTGVGCVRLLNKTRDTPKQSLITDRSKRAANVSGAYMATDANQIRYKRILLVDDILTTGATASECARTLLMAGADSVSCVTVASAMGGSRKRI